jgi:hypothetical protein
MMLFVVALLLFADLAAGYWIVLQQVAKWGRDGNQ